MPSPTSSKRCRRARDRVSRARPDGDATRDVFAVSDARGREGARDADRGRMREAPSRARERLQIMSSSEDEDEDEDAARRAIAGLGKRATFIRACETIARCARRGETRETGANVDRSKETLGRAVMKISSTLRSRYGADAVEAWASGLRACEACAEALGDEEAVEAVEALRASTPTANAREDADLSLIHI